MIRWLKKMFRRKVSLNRDSVVFEKEARLMEAFSELSRLTKDLQAEDKNLFRIRSQIAEATDAGLAILEGTNDD